MFNSLNEVVINYSNNAHITTKFKPIIIFNCEDDKTLKLVFENTINSNKNYDVDVNLLKINDTILIFNNIDIKYIKKNNIYIIEKSRIKKEYFA